MSVSAEAAQPVPDGDDDARPVLSALATEMVRLFKEQFGRGPTAARATWTGDVATVREFCEPVERLTGRKVRAFISGIDTQIDGLCVETFVVHPQDRRDARSRTELAEPEPEPEPPA